MERLVAKAEPFWTGKGPVCWKPLTGGGSSRDFYRLSRGNETLVLCVTQDREEMEYYIEFAEFFRGAGVCVPAFYRYSLSEGYIVMEDAGRQSLCDFVHAADSREEIYSVYKKSVEALRTLQTLDFGKSPRLMSRPFDYASLRWETDYFSRHCLLPILGESFREELEKEFHGLAFSVAREDVCAMHRDFQSQNIYLSGDRLFFIDFQGARTGCAYYDAASLIYDPYVPLDWYFREKLVKMYMTYVGGQADGEREIFRLCALQRLMQALGAYGNLGLNKNKPAFLEHIVPALLLLESLLVQKKDFPRLTAAVRRLREKSGDFLEQAKKGRQ